jgi:hypothetical protein
LYGKDAHEGDTGTKKSDSGASEPTSQITEHKDEVVDEAFNPTATSLGMDEEEFERRLKQDKLNWFMRLVLRVRYELWHHSIDHVLLVNLSRSKGKLYLKKPSLFDFGLFQLLQAAV